MKKKCERLNLVSSLKNISATGYTFTLFTECIVLISGLATLKLSALFFGTAGFALFSLARRAISLTSFVLLLGLGISIPRYIALSATKKSDEVKQTHFLLAGIILSIVTITFFFCLALTIPDYLAKLFFGDFQKRNMILPIAIAVSGLHLHTLTYAYFRGNMAMRAANILQIINMGLAVPVTVLLADNNVVRSITLVGIWWIWVTIFILIWICSKANLSNMDFKTLKSSLRDLIIFGVPRVPGEFALFGLFSIPTFIVANKFGIIPAGFFSFSISFLQLTCSLFAVIGIILLPYISKLLSENDFDRIKSIVSISILCSTVLITIFVVIVINTADYIIPYFMGIEFIESVKQVKLLIFGAIPYVIYMVIRNPLDALSVWPYNSINLLISLLVATILISFFRNYILPPTAMNISLWILGSLSFVFWKRNYLRCRIQNNIKR